MRTKTVPNATVAGVCAILKPFAPDITPPRLIGAIKAYEPEDLPGGRSRLINTTKAAAQLGVSKFTVRRWAREGKIPVVTRNGRHHIRQRDLEQLLEGQEVA